MITINEKINYSNLTDEEKENYNDFVIHTVSQEGTVYVIKCQLNDENGKWKCNSHFDEVDNVFQTNNNEFVVVFDDKNNDTTDEELVSVVKDMLIEAEAIFEIECWDELPKFTKKVINETGELSKDGGLSYMIKSPENDDYYIYGLIEWDGSEDGYYASPKVESYPKDKKSKLVTSPACISVDMFNILEDQEIEMVTKKGTEKALFSFRGVVD